MTKRKKALKAQGGRLRQKEEQGGGALRGRGHRTGKGVGEGRGGQAGRWASVLIQTQVFTEC